MKTKKYYVISSTKGTKQEILEKIANWMEDGDFNENSQVYQITEKTKVFKPVNEISLKEKK